MDSVFLNTENKLSANGIYGVNFYTLGVPHTVIVDDYVPVDKGSNGTYTSYTTKPGSDGAIWGMILEKAFAKYHGNYFHTEAGWAARAVNSLYGAPNNEYWHNEVAADKVWKYLVAADKRGDIITTGTYEASGKNANNWRNAIGLCMGHAYTVLTAFDLKDKAGKSIKLVRVRDPLGNDKFATYTGEYKTGSKKWTADLKKQTGETFANDGEYIMSFAEYFKYMDSTIINYDTSKMSRAHFLILNDTNKVKMADSTDCTAAACSYHKFFIKSATTQKVYLTTATWR